jgi:hypothetical protein
MVRKLVRARNSKRRKPGRKKRVVKIRSYRRKASKRRGIKK